MIGSWEWDKEDAYDDVLSWLEGRLNSYHAIKVVEKLKLHGSIARPFEQRPEVAERACEVGRRLATV